MPKVVDAEVQREEIRAAARDVFARRGVRGTGLAHVAEAAGMGRSSLYHYYPDKESLVADMLREMLGGERELFRSSLGGPGSPIERIERLTTSCAALFPEWAGFGRMILDLRLGDADLLRDYFREFRRELAAVIEEGQRDGSLSAEQDADSLASILIGAIDGLLLQYFVDSRSLPGPEELAATLGEATRRVLEA